MAKLKVAELGNPVLRKRATKVDARDVSTSEIQTLIDDLIETMHEYEGAGLAAPQVHSSRRVVVFEVKNNSRYPEAPNIPLTIAINPEIEVLTREKLGMWEGCLSVPGIRGYVERPSKLKLKALDRNGEVYEQVLDGFSAVVIQHECDHLRGKVYLDRMKNLLTLTHSKEFDRYWSDEA
ncbi:MAG: peptide deformylase [Planctomycetes bacterium]|nr:peptide deformylase [Planctomycetota bacterium]